MKKSRFTESQIVAVLQIAEQGQKIADLCRELGISEATFYSWRSKYGGMQVNELKRVKELEEENARLKRMYADLSLVNDALKQVLDKSTGACRTQSRCRVDEFLLSLDRAARRACGAPPGHRIRQGLSQDPHKGSVVNKKKLYRIYTAMGLNIQRRKRKRLPTRVKQALFVPKGPNQFWSMDFMHDSFWDGKPFRVLNIVDDFNRQALRIKPDTSLTAERVVRVLNQLIESRGVSAMIRVDNGSELVSIKLDLWCRENGVTLVFIEPGKPTQNAFIERFNRTLRTEVLNS